MEHKTNNKNDFTISNKKLVVGKDVITLNEYIELTRNGENTYKGLLLQHNDNLESLRLLAINNIPFILVNFANFECGIPYTQARVLRSVHNYHNKIIANNVYIEHIQLIQRCGVNQAILADEYNNVKQQQYRNTYTICYQDAPNNTNLRQAF